MNDDRRRESWGKKCYNLFWQIKNIIEYKARDILLEDILYFFLTNLIPQNYF